MNGSLYKQTYTVVGCKVYNININATILLLSLVMLLSPLTPASGPTTQAITTTPAQ